MRPIGDEPRGCLPSKKNRYWAPFRALEARCRRWPAGTAAARVHRCSKTSTRPLFATLFARDFEAACASSTSASGRCHEHDRDRPNTPNRWVAVGATACFGPEPTNRLEPGNRRRYAGSGAEKHRLSTLPTTIARGRDFAPTPIAPGTSCREPRPLPCSEKRGERAASPSRRTLARRARR